MKYAQRKTLSVGSTSSTVKNNSTYIGIKKAPLGVSLRILARYIREDPHNYATIGAYIAQQRE